MPSRSITPETVLSFKTVSDAQISPDGDLVAFVVGESYLDGTKLPRSGIWTVSTGGGDPTRVTFGPRADTAGRWSPDGKTLAFLSDREKEGQKQIYLLPREGGEAARLTHVEGEIPSPRGLNPIAWSSDGARIAFLKTDPETEDEKRRKRERDDVIEFERNHKFTRLYVVTVETGDTVCVSPDGLQIWEFCWAPQGQEFAAVVSDLPYEQHWYGNRLVRFAAGDSEAQTLRDTRRQVATPAWSPNGSRIAYVSSTWSDRGVVAGAVYVMPASGGDAIEMAGAQSESTSWIEWNEDSKSLLTAAQEQGGAGLAVMDAASGERSPLWHDEVVVAEPNWLAFSRDRQGVIALVREDPENPRDVWLALPGDGGLDWRQLTHMHPQAADIEVGTVETVHWKGADGWDMQGLLVSPPGSGGNGPLPMVTVVHGGPTGVHSPRYFAAAGWTEVLAAKGVAVFLPNPRGSTSWGLDFAECNLGDLGGKDWEDILLGIDCCVERGTADPDRLGIGGWS